MSDVKSKYDKMDTSKMNADQKLRIRREQLLGESLLLMYDTDLKTVQKAQSMPNARKSKKYMQRHLTDSYFEAVKFADKHPALRESNWDASTGLEYKERRKEYDKSFKL